MTSSSRLAGGVALALLGAMGASAADLKRGALLFQTCTACHSPLGDGVGPDLAGIVGKKAAQTAGFDYSPAMRASGLTWDESTLRRFITNPQQTVRGTKMTFVGYSNPDDVEAVLAYIKSQQGAP